MLIVRAVRVVILFIIKDLRMIHLWQSNFFLLICIIERLRNVVFSIFFMQ